MKISSKIVFLFKDAEGFGTSIFDALQLNPNLHTKKEEVRFELSLEKYGIKDCKACGDVVHFVDQNGFYQVSVLLLQNYEPPVIACVTNEVLKSITEDNSSTLPTIILPYFVSASKLNSGAVSPTVGNRKVPLYGTNIGPATDFTRTVIEGLQKLPPSLQIHYEPLACLLQFVRVLNLPTILVFGPRGQYQSKGTTEEALEALYEMGEFLAKNLGVCFTRDGIHLNLTEKTKLVQEPWRALYG